MYFTNKFHCKICTKIIRIVSYLGIPRWSRYVILARESQFPLLIFSSLMKRQLVTSSLLFMLFTVLIVFMVEALSKQCLPDGRLLFFTLLLEGGVELLAFLQYLRTNEIGWWFSDTLALRGWWPPVNLVRPLTIHNHSWISLIIWMYSKY